MQRRSFLKLIGGGTLAFTTGVGLGQVFTKEVGVVVDYNTEGNIDYKLWSRIDNGEYLYNKYGKPFINKQGSFTVYKTNDRYWNDEWQQRWKDNIKVWVDRGYGKYKSKSISGREYYWAFIDRRDLDKLTEEQAMLLHHTEIPLDYIKEKHYR